MIRNSGNPVFKQINKMEYEQTGMQAATYSGVGLKTLYYLIVTVAGVFLGLFLLYNNPDALVIALVPSLIVGLISAIVAMRSYKLALVFGTIYCLCEGLVLGLLSLLCEEFYPGIVITTVAVTMSIVLVCALCFITGLVKITKKFYRFLTIFALGFMVSMLLMFIFSLLGFLVEISWPVYLLIGGMSCLLATFFLMADMDQAYQLVTNGGPKEFEWMVSFGIAYTVLWIYLEVLRFLVVIMGHRN